MNLVTSSITSSKSQVVAALSGKSIGDRNAAARTFSFDNIAASPYEFDNWNIADWNRLAAEWRIPEPDATQ